MRELFPVRGPTGGGGGGPGPFDRCKGFFKKYCHPFQIGTGLLFSTIGLGVTAVGLMYADGINFAIQNVSDLPAYFEGGGDIAGSIDYVRESYRGSMSEALETGWKQVPFSYSIGHYVGGKLKDKIMEPFRR